MLGVEGTTVLHELDGHGVLTLTLNRPERNNAWNTEMERALHGLLLQAAASDEVRAIVLTGAGRSFCPGVDTENLEQSAAGSRPTTEGRMRIYLPAMIPKPVIGAINGACAGFGLVTALACDVRFANEEAKIATAFARRGLPGEEAVTWFLPRIVGHAVALELLLSARPITGREAADLRIVHRAVPAGDLLAAAQDYARDLADNCSPSAMAVIKRQVFDDWAGSVHDSRAEARRLVLRMRDEPDFREGVASYVERRPPSFPAYTETIDPSDYPMD